MPAPHSRPLSERWYVQAGLRVCVQAEDVELFPDARLEPFRIAPASADGADMVLRVCSGGRLRAPAGAPLFTSGCCWAVWGFPDGSREFVRLPPPDGDPEPVWTARRRATGDRWDVLVGRRLRAESGWTCPFAYPLDYLALLCALADRGGLLIHASTVVCEGGAWVCAGRSGVGKSTLARLLAAEADLRVLGDDRAALRRIDGVWTAHGTPWPGTAGIVAVDGAPLRGVALLEQAPLTRMVRLTARQARHALLPHVSVPWYDAAAAPRVLGQVARLAEETPVYTFAFRPTAEAVEALRRAAAGAAG